MKLRADAWSATEASAKEVELKVTQGPDRVATWTVDKDGTLTRSVQQGKRVIEQQRWREIAKGWRFEVKEPEITVKDPVAGELRMVMELKLLEKAK